jgi:hypothetical protein
MRDKLSKARDWAIIGGALLLAVPIMAWVIWTIWPYPTVTSTGQAYLTNLPADGKYRTGDVIRWATPQVCQPSGEVNATVYAVLEFKNPETGGVAISKTPVATREFDVRGFPECVENNPTTAYVDGNLPTGTYRFEVYACAVNTGPRDKCDTFQGPKDVKIIRVAGNEPEGFKP